MALLSIPLANAAGDPDRGTSAAVTKSQSDEQSRTNAVDAKTGPKANDRAVKAPPAKHPPTAIMDQATSTDKSATEKPKHGPTNVMDRAAPDQKSPGAASSSDAPAK
jgi:hypothetical protein